MHKYLTIALVYLMIMVHFSSCSIQKKLTQSNEKIQNDCVSDDDVKKYLPQFKSIIETMSGDKTEFKQIFRTCHKIKFFHPVLSVILYRFPEMKKTHASTVNNVSDEEKKQCLKKAIQDLEGLNGPNFINRILTHHQKRYSNEWTDQDIGPIKWLQCNSSSLTSWYFSLETLIHELAHNLYKKDIDKDCLFSIDEIESNKDLCFQLSDQLPLRSLAKVDLKSIPKNKGHDFFQKIQKIYLTDTDQPLINLLDELNSYSISLRMQTLFLKKGASFVFKPDGARNPATVTLFLLFVKNYFERLKNMNTSLYYLTINQNRKSLKLILKNGEDFYQDWLIELKKNNENEKMAEKKFYQEYKRKSDFFSDLQ